MTVLLEAPLHVAALTLSADGTVTKRVQVAKTGRFWDPRYGRFAITTKEFATWIKNFDALWSRSADRMGMPVDIDHGPEKRGDTRAAGWVTQLDTLGEDGKTATPQELWATVEWNKLGQELVGDRVYAYLSPSYTAEYRDETGKAHGTAMNGAGLTNRPFLRMATVTLDALDDAGIELSDRPEEARSDSPTAMTDFLKKAREALQLGEDVSEDKVLEAITEAAAKPDPAKPTGDAKTLAEQAKDQGLIVLTEIQFTDLQAGVAKGVAADKALAETKRDAAWDKALEETKVVPAQKDSMFELHENQPELFFKLLGEAQPQAHTAATGGSGGGTPSGGAAVEQEARDAGVSLDTDAAALDAKVQKVLTEHPEIDYGTALDRVLAEA